jgi:two-component system, NtrC family, sensor histidine kinase HydH
VAKQSVSTADDEVVENREDSAINRRLRAQYAEIARLAGGLAHEIKNPLSTMSLNLDLLVEDFHGAETPRDKRVLQKLVRVRKETERLNDIVEDFLRFAKVQHLKTEPSDLNAVVDDLRDFCEPQAMGQGIVIRTQYHSGLPLVPLDVDLFKQALWNLIRNAHHAMPEGGELILQTHLEGDCAVLDVTDTGVGMTPEVAGQVFDAFYSTKPGGSGLGLPTTRKIVEAHGGSISLQSEPGQGSRFTLRLPLGVELP